MPSGIIDSEVLAMSRYPSSADLAAFRRSIPFDPDMRTPHPFPSWPELHPNGIGAAWDSERQHGIGYRSDPYDRTTFSHRIPAIVSSVARREASLMRSRAYATSLADGCHLLHEHGYETSDGIDCHPASEPSYIIPDYWDDEAPRSPLPVVYGQPFSIIN
jgi:hypothetical protein